MAGSLDGVRVLDCTHVIAGAYCSMLLADLGADVIKIEPLKGEVTRGRPGEAFQPYDFVNRNKRAVAIDWALPEGAEVVRELAAGADVFVENFRPGALERHGLGYEPLAQANPRLVYASISGFGQTGPYRDRGGFDLVAQAMSGIMSFTGEIGAERPVSAGVPMSDLAAGSFAALGVLAALNHRHLTGRGQRVDTSLLESALAYTVWESGAALTTGAVAERIGARHRLSAPYEALKTGDGYMVVGVNNQRLWARLCEALEAPELAADPDYAKPGPRLANRDALQVRLEAILAGASTAHWVERLGAFGVPCGPINNIAEALADPQVQARGFLKEVAGRRFPSTPITLSEAPVELRRGPARVGEHTREVLAEAGFEAAAIEGLIERKVVGG
ncbi:MAG: CoA transferase [Phenylobacterium sp.]